MENQLIPKEAIDRLREIGSDSNGEFIREYFEALLSPLPDKLEAIKKAVSEKNYHELRQAAHSIKSSCLNAGIEKIVDITLELENMGINKKIEEEGKLIEELSLLITALKKEVSELPEFKS